MRRSGCKREGQDAARWPAGRWQSLSKPRLKNKGARATFQWKMSRAGPDAPPNGYLAQPINHSSTERPGRSQRVTVRGGRGLGRQGGAERGGGTPHLPSSALRCSSPSPDSYLTLAVSGGYMSSPPPFLSLLGSPCCFEPCTHCTMLTSVSQLLPPMTLQALLAALSQHWGMWTSPHHTAHTSFIALLHLSIYPYCMQLHRHDGNTLLHMIQKKKATQQKALG